MDKWLMVKRICMKVSAQKLIQFRWLLLWSFPILFFGCSTTRRVEIKQDNEVYKTLGMKHDRKDNVALYQAAAFWLHVPHIDGGTSRKGTDCSYLVYIIYKTVYHKIIERNSASILNKDCKRISRRRLKEGDLVFFNTMGSPKSKSHVNHVGIFLKDNKFMHASTSKGVIISDLDENYYRKVWVCGGRVVKFIR
jgi:hypothetical protein